MREKRGGSGQKFRSFKREKRDSNCYLLTRDNELERERRRDVRFRERRIQLGKKLLTVFNASAREQERMLENLEQS